MMIPTIHLNGTGADTLMREIDAAIVALVTAYHAVGAITVHGRDYYPQGTAAYEVARTEQINRLRKIEEVRNELMRMYNKIEEVK